MQDAMNWEVAVSFHGYVGDGGEVGLREVNIFDSVYVTTFPAFPDVKSNFKFDPCVYKGAKSYVAIKKAMVEVLDVEGNPGYYQVKTAIVPHFQVEGLDVELSLVGKIPSK